ncbi:hypothetical protein Tco_0748833 [Tanacetum coccineum]|uniref:Uncharacterized protein n=1 Tax=Tanacetum coccineum TaxID=301880 RepID=A0ABQ4YXI1_9ASTR
MSSLWSTGGGMNSEAGSGHSGDDGNGNDVAVPQHEGDSGDGGGDGGVGAAAYSAIRAFMDGDIGGLSLTVFRALRRCV